MSQRTESPDGLRRAAIVGGLYRTACAVPLLYEDRTGRLAPCRYCIGTAPDGSRRAANVGCGAWTYGAMGKGQGGTCADPVGSQSAEI